MRHVLRSAPLLALLAAACAGPRGATPSSSPTSTAASTATVVIPVSGMT